MKLCIILPAYNEAPVIGSVLLTLKKYLKRLKHVRSHVVVIDDGSIDKTSEIALKHKVKILKHVINRGLGGSLATGLTYAKKNNFDLALTMDSDGQHFCTDISKVIKPIINNSADVVIGSRAKLTGNMPFDRVIINFFSNVLTLLLFDIWTSDSLSGFRAFNKHALNSINLKTQGMEVSNEFFKEIKKHQLRLVEVPIRVRYTQYSRRKGQSNLNIFNVPTKLLLRLFR